MEKFSKDIITIVLADDHPLLREGLKHIIEKNTKMLVVGEAEDGEQALRLINELKPLIAIIDIDMPKLDGLKVVKTLKDRNISVETIILTMYNKENIFNRAMDLGINGYVMKDSAATEIVLAIQSVMEGKHFVSSSITDLIINRSQLDITKDKTGLALLTITERKILKLIADNMKTKDIADELFISTHTVETHRKNICQKLNLHGTNALLHFVVEYKDII